MNQYLFFDNASTTKCCDAAVEVLKKYAEEDYGNPSSNHVFGHRAARGIREARFYFSDLFKVQPDQVIFTGSGTEADNLAIYGIVMGQIAKNAPSPRVLFSAIEHSAVRKTVDSLAPFKVEVQSIPVDSNGQIVQSEYLQLLRRSVSLISIQQVNNIVGAVLPVEDLARQAKELNPTSVFHTDAIQAFGKIKLPHSPSPVDLVSISSHKIHGPKGVGALIVLNRKLLESALRPLIWGGEQESGFRSGTQNPGLISGFHKAAEHALAQQNRNNLHIRQLRDRCHDLLVSKGLMNSSTEKSAVHWLSPPEAVPHIINLSAPGFLGSALARCLEERGCLVSVGSACNSKKPEPDPVLTAMGFSKEIQNASFRISFSEEIQIADIDRLVGALEESIQLMSKLTGKKGRTGSTTGKM